MFSYATFLEVYLGIFANPKKSHNIEQMRKTTSPQCLVDNQIPHVYAASSDMTFADILFENKEKTNQYFSVLFKTKVF